MIPIRSRYAPTRATIGSFEDLPAMCKRRPIHKQVKPNTATANRIRSISNCRGIIRLLVDIFLSLVFCSKPIKSLLKNDVKGHKQHFCIKYKIFLLKISIFYVNAIAKFFHLCKSYAPSLNMYIQHIFGRSHV